MYRELAIGNVYFDQNIFVGTSYTDSLFQAFLSGQNNKIGIWVEGTFSWIDSKEWSITTNDISLNKMRIRAVHPELKLILSIEEEMRTLEGAFIRKLIVENNNRNKINVRLFFYQNLNKEAEAVANTIFFSPSEEAMVHYKNNKYYLFSGLWNEMGIKQYNTSLKASWDEKAIQMLHTGTLCYSPISHGNVSSMFTLEGAIEPNAKEEISYWATEGNTLSDVKRMNETVKRAYFTS